MVKQLSEVKTKDEVIAEFLQTIFKRYHDKAVELLKSRPRRRGRPRCLEKSLVCPRCGAIGILDIRAQYDREYLYVVHNLPNKGKKYCYLGPVSDYVYGSAYLTVPNIVQLRNIIVKMKKAGVKKEQLVRWFAQIISEVYG